MAVVLLFHSTAEAEYCYVINLASTIGKPAIERLPAVATGHDDQLYITTFTKDGKVFHRVQLGFYPDRVTADEVRKRIIPQFPDAWITTASNNNCEQAIACCYTPALDIRPSPQPGKKTHGPQGVLAEPDGEPRWYPAVKVRQAMPASGEKKGAAFDFDAPPQTRFRLTPDLNFGAKVELEGELEKNFDLDSDRADDLKILEPQLSLAFSYTPTETLQAYLNIKSSQRFVDDDRDKKNNETRLEVNQAFLSFSGLFDGSMIKLGRQRFQDEREWLYDEELDGVRLFHTFSRFAVEFSLSKRNDRDLLQNQQTGDMINYFIHGYHATNKDNAIGLYAFAQDDRDDREDPQEDRTLFGIHANGEFRDHLDYWLELAYLRGEFGSNDIRAWGFDAGSTYIFDYPWEPSITLGYAFGSGDDDPQEGKDRNFRQTGFQDNTAKYNGLIRLKYYGEMVDPELSNLQVATLGLGLRPTRRTSLDLVYHNLRQHKATTDVHDWEIDADPNGRSTDIGNEIDFIVGYRIKPHHKGSLIIGRFNPGNAFPNDADNALFGELELQYEF
ncbi:MAG: alginate export family protein [Pseudomonadota bacterium]